MRYRYHHPKSCTWQYVRRPTTRLGLLPQDVTNCGTKSCARSDSSHGGRLRHPAEIAGINRANYGQLSLFQVVGSGRLSE
jgi:hypothetical protein